MSVGQQRKGRALNKAKKGKGMHGGRWNHGFVPLNAIAKRLKEKKFRQQGVRRKKLVGSK